MCPTGLTNVQECVPMKHTGSGTQQKFNSIATGGNKII